MRTANESSDQGRPAPARDVPLPLAEAVVSCLALRDIPRLRAHYPSAMRAEDAAELRASLTGHLRAALADSQFDDLRSHDRGLNLDAPATDEDLTALLFALLLRVPGTLPSAPNREIAPDAMRVAVAACQDRIGPPLKDIVTQLGEIKLFDCRIPEGDPTFLDPRRSLQLLRAYWSVCRSLVLHQIDAPIGYQPHPLRRIIVGFTKTLPSRREPRSLVLLHGAWVVVPMSFMALQMVMLPEARRRCTGSGPAARGASVPRRASPGRSPRASPTSPAVPLRGSPRRP